MESTVPKSQTWSDEFFTYVLLSQSETVLQQGTDDEITGYISSYTQYTHQEFQDLITKDLKAQTINALDQSLDAVRNNKVIETKKLLEQYYEENPLFSKVHKKKGEYYSVTSEKQNYLMSMIALVDQSKALGVDFTPTWNSTGEACEPWTEAELRQLSLEIAQFVYPAVSKQQAYEKQIRSMEMWRKFRHWRLCMGKQLSKHIILFLIGGIAYVGIELLWRGYSHWTMFILGGLCFICCGLLNEIIPWEMVLSKQMLMGAVIVTLLEFLTGMIVNVKLGWNVWDYSNLPLNICGQICPIFFIAWYYVSGLAIILDDYLRYWLFHEEKPHYKLF